MANKYGTIIDIITKQVNGEYFAEPHSINHPANYEQAIVGGVVVISIEDFFNYEEAIKYPTVECQYGIAVIMNADIAVKAANLDYTSSNEEMLASITEVENIVNKKLAKIHCRTTVDAITEVLECVQDTVDVPSLVVLGTLDRAAFDAVPVYDDGEIHVTFSEELARFEIGGLYDTTKYELRQWLHFHGWHTKEA